MSLLTATQGTPNRVFALLRFLQEAKTTVTMETLANWFAPKNRADGADVARPKEALEQTISAARSLGLIPENAPIVVVDNVPDTIQEFANIAHARLRGLPATDANAVILKVYAWFVLRAERDAAGLHRIDRDSLVTEIDSAFPRSDAEDAKTFNTTKFKPWARWVSFVGLGVELPNTPFFPDPTERIRCELQDIAKAIGLNRDTEFRLVLDELRNRMPYLDSGPTFSEMVEQTGWKPRYLSRVLSNAFRELHQEGMIRLTALGDSADRIQFSPDPNDVTGLPGANKIRICVEADSAQ